MKKLLIATTNQAKRNEIAQELQSLVDKGLTLLSLADVSISEEPEETGKTFAENARIKAFYYGEETDLPTIADDGGLMINALRGEPGVKSRRWAGPDATDKVLIDYTLERMKDVPPEKRSAQFSTCVCFYLPINFMSVKSGSVNEGLYVCQQASIQGTIAKKPLTYDTQGYPYRALFIVDQYSKYYDELTAEEHQEINHRLQALKTLKPVIERHLEL